MDADVDEVRNRPKTKGEQAYIQKKRREVRACKKLRDHIDRLYEGARRNTTVKVVVE